MLDETSAIMAAYLGIGFLFLIAVFLIRGPQQTWFDLTGANPDEPQFLSWLGVFFPLFFWPLILVIGTIVGMVYGVVWLAMVISTLIERTIKKGGAE
jgi:hypothetical protein